MKKCKHWNCLKPKYRNSGYCNMHLSRKKKGQDMDAPPRGRPRGTGGLTVQGYVRLYMPKHPNADKHGRVLEHTYVMSKILGRPLLPFENVHHKNGDRADNRPENLELWAKYQPSGQRVEDLVSWAREILRIYDE